MPLHEYDVVINGMATTLLLTADEAKRRGLTTDAPKTQRKAASAPRNKAAAAAANKTDKLSSGDGSAA